MLKAMTTRYVVVDCPSHGTKRVRVTCQGCCDEQNALVRRAELARFLQDNEFVAPPELAHTLTDDEVYEAWGWFCEYLHSDYPAGKVPATIAPFAPPYLRA